MNEITLLAGSASGELGAGIAAELGIEPGACLVDRFPDGELHVEVEAPVRGRDVYIVQSTGPPVELNLFQLFLLADACRRRGAANVGGVVPYLGYARQDRRTTGREPIALRLVADMISDAGLDRVVAVDLHNPATEGFFGIFVEHVSAVPTLADALRPWLGERPVIVAPDLGAVRLADRYARRLDLPVAIVHKTRISGREVKVQRVTGEVKGRTPVIVDDMISTGATVEAAARALLDADCEPAIAVAATHPLLARDAADRLRSLPLTRIVVTDSVQPETAERLPLDTVSLAPMLADAIRRLRGG